jgi:dihydropteroate synthase
MSELRLRDRILYVDRPAIMGILNVNTDSFSDPGPRTVDQVVEQALTMWDEGAAIIDIGAQSSITLRKPVPVEREVAEVGIVVDEVLQACPEAIISVDTFKVPVARAVLEKGAHLINDVSGLRTPQIASLCAAHQAGLVIMHTSAPPLTRLQDPGLYRNISVEVVGYLERARAVALERGVRPDSIVLDPGPDFTKTPAQTIELLASIRKIIDLANPILLALSRKDFIGALTSRPPSARGAGSLGAIAALRHVPRQILRVHDVVATRDMLTVLDAITGRARIPPDLRLPEWLRHDPISDP